ncbi:TspO/MBR family-domain-containing protein [Pavlovales sp. CCMP2436]|nr:TspO/MBR family-domain-containing protein [Pavlovales sp. CCMP2436]|mmetsp:Transcript_1420/g.3709  ORF Transcript_1420/g.3709 Transcript_1420/m.3709 type:complete len:229 (+) Transcript_1420:97-783(+)
MYSVCALFAVLAAAPARGFSSASRPLLARAPPKIHKISLGRHADVRLGYVPFPPPPLPQGHLAWAFSSLAAGLVSTIFGVQIHAESAEKWYRNLHKPSWYIPSTLFRPVWFIMFALLGYSASLVADAKNVRLARWAIQLFCVDMVINFSWAPIFFGARKVAFAAKWAVLLLLVSIANVWIFGAVNPLAGALLVPYLAWVAWLASLNIAIAQLNKHNSPPSHKAAHGDI